MRSLLQGRSDYLHMGLVHCWMALRLCDAVCNCGYVVCGDKWLCDVTTTTFGETIRDMITRGADFLLRCRLCSLPAWQTVLMVELLRCGKENVSCHYQCAFFVLMLFGHSVYLKAGILCSVKAGILCSFKAGMIFLLKQAWYAGVPLKQAWYAGFLGTSLVRRIVLGWMVQIKKE